MARTPSDTSTDSTNVAVDNPAPVRNLDASAETGDVQTAQSQTAVNAAPNDESSAGDPRPVDTLNSTLVYNDGTPVGRPSDSNETGQFSLTAPDGTPVTVTSSVRRDVLLARGYQSA